VGTSLPVTVQAQDQYGHLVSTFGDDVTLLANLSATVANGGLVNITAGTGTVNVDDTVAETVTLSLSDTQGTGLNVSSQQQVTFAAALSLRSGLAAQTVTTEAPPQDH
jgi:hypothetical protein